MNQTLGNGDKAMPAETVPTHCGSTRKRVRIALQFLLTGFTIWIIYDALMLLMGGTSVGPGTGWQKWYFVRWMMGAATDGLIGLHVFQCFFSSAFCAAASSSFVFYAKEDRASKRTILLLWSVAIALQYIFLLNMFDSGGSRFWWPAPSTYVPASRVRLFEVCATALRFAMPFFVYWITILVRYLWNKRHGFPPETPPVEETHLY